MISVRSNCPMFGVLMRKYACSGMSTCTPFGTYTNEPPDHAAVFNAENLLSLLGMHLPKYFLTSSGYFCTAVSVSTKMTPCSSRSFWIEL